MQIGIHARLQDGHAAKLGELGRMRIVVECTSNQDIETGVARFSGSLNKIGSGEGAEPALSSL